MNGMAQTQPWMLLVEVPLSKSVCSEVDPAVCEPSTEAGLQDAEETLCAGGFSVSHSQILKTALTIVPQAFSPEFLFENKSPFAPLSLPADIPCWIGILSSFPPLLF